MTDPSGFHVKKPGLMTLIQDAGRYGKHGIGLTCGGPLDQVAFYWANRLLGNDYNATLLEISFGGLTLTVNATSQIALTGATVPLSINGKTVSMWRSHNVKPGDEITVGFASEGCRSYLAIAGGFDIEPSFGSSATVVRENIGGLNGGKLQEGDFLPCSNHSGGKNQLLPGLYRPHYGRQAHLRVVLGYQQAAFSRVQLAHFFSGEYQTTDRSDRMGYRLAGPEIKPSIDGILSEGICHGAIQVPADGQPIVLLNDRQTIGGYPKLGSVMQLDTGKLAQLTPGGTVTFEEVSIEDAHRINLLARQQLAAIQLTPVDSE